MRSNEYEYVPFEVRNGLNQIQNETNIKRKIDARCEQLLKHFREYKEENQLEEAIKSDIKWRQLRMISQSLKKLLV